VKEIFLEELMNAVVVVKLSTTLPKMLNLRDTCVPSLRRRTLLYLTTLYVSHKCTRSLLSADIWRERVRHKPDTIIGQRLMRLPLVDPRISVTAPIFVETVAS
jgi:hypothetical protein